MSQLILRFWRWLFFKKFDKSLVSIPKQPGDWEIIGHWGVAQRNDKGEWESEIEGNLVSETVERQTEDGNTELVERWMPDTYHINNKI
jgi:hypothetical protein